MVVEPMSTGDHEGGGESACADERGRERTASGQLEREGIIS
jgi:hypothetical protein